MVNINNLRATVLLIKATLHPVSREDLCLPHPEIGSRTIISQKEFSMALARIDGLLRPDSTLELHFEEVLPLAAPFLLYRLKSAGFTGCKAVLTKTGILLTGMR